MDLQNPNGFNLEHFPEAEITTRKPISHHQQENLGKNTTRTEVYSFKNKDNAFAKDSNIHGGKIINSNILAYETIKQTELTYPQVGYNPKEEKVFIQEIKDTTPVKNISTPINEDKFWEHAVTRFLIGDTDLHKNMLAINNGEDFVNIDYDMSGHDIETAIEKNHNALKTKCGKIGLDYTHQKFNEYIDQVAQTIDTKKLEDSLNNNPYVEQSWEMYITPNPASIENVLKNIEKVQQSYFDVEKYLQN